MGVDSSLLSSSRRLRSVTGDPPADGACRDSLLLGVGDTPGVAVSDGIVRLAVGGMSIENGRRQNHKSSNTVTAIKIVETRYARFILSPRVVAQNTALLSESVDPIEMHGH